MVKYFITLKAHYICGAELSSPLESFERLACLDCLYSKLLATLCGVLGDSCKFSRTVDVVFNCLSAGYEYKEESGRTCLATTPVAKNINLLIKCVENCTY